MLCESEIKASVLGSFKKAKPEIDLTIEELQDNGVNVLGPDRGSVVIPRKGGLYVPYRDFAPLPSEVGMTRDEVEQQFIEYSVLKSDFVVVVNPDGYVGEMVSYEMKVADSREITIYTRYPIQPEHSLRLNKNAREVKNLPVGEIVQIEREAKALQCIGLVHPSKLKK